jgi:uncharacterized membrane protein
MENFPLHPVFVHFPIALYFFELMLLGLWAARGDSEYRRFARLAFQVGYAFMIVAMIAGYYDAGGIVPRVRLHFFSAVGVFVVYTVRAFYWWKARDGAPNDMPRLLVGALAGCAVVMLTAYLGGEMVFGY